MVKNTYGTGCFMLMHLGRHPVASHNRLLTTVGWRVDGATDYLLEGSVFMGGATVQWLRDGLGIIRRRPKWKSWRPACRIAAACSWCRPCRPGRAALGCLRARLAVWPEPRQHARPHRPRRAGSHRLPERRADGGDAERCVDPLTEVRADGAARNDLLMQFQADLLGVPVVRPKSPKPPRWAPPTWPAWLSASGTRRKKSPPNGAAAAASNQPCGADQRADLLSTWARAVERSKSWTD
jgi:glycerol kinase